MNEVLQTEQSPTQNPTGPSSLKGATILGLGILGLLCICPIFSLNAWVIGIKERERGRQHAENAIGMKLTNVGYYLGIVGSFLWIATSVVVTLVLLLRSGA